MEYRSSERDKEPYNIRFPADGNVERTPEWSGRSGTTSNKQDSKSFLLSTHIEIPGRRHVGGFFRHVFILCLRDVPGETGGGGGSDCHG